MKLWMAVLGEVAALAANRSRQTVRVADSSDEGHWNKNNPGMGYGSVILAIILPKLVTKDTLKLINIKSSRWSLV